MVIDVLQLLIIALGFSLTGISILALSKQIKWQSSSTSVQVCLSFFDRLRDTDMRTIHGEILLKKTLNLNEGCTDWTNLIRFLNHFEHIAIAEDRNVIDFDVTMSYFSSYLTDINNSDQITNFLNMQKGKSFSYLKILLHKHKETYLI